MAVYKIRGPDDLDPDLPKILIKESSVNHGLNPYMTSEIFLN